jgi:hypothetical protein
MPDTTSRKITVELHKIRILEETVKIQQSFPWFAKNL